jgi:hypothetical protein
MIVNILIGVAGVVLAVAVVMAIYFAVTPKLRGKLSIKEARRPEIPTPYGLQKPPSDAELRESRKEHPPAIKCAFCPRAAVWRRMAEFACDVHRKKLKGHPRRIVGQPTGGEPRCAHLLDVGGRCKLRVDHPGHHWNGSGAINTKESKAENDG